MAIKCKTVNRSKLKEYNIYFGLGGGFGGASYQYTTLCESAEDAEKEAYESAVEEYQSYEGFNSIPTWSDSLDAAMEENPGVPEDELHEIADEIYNSIMEEWIEYYCILTEDDDIEEDDLIRDYVIEDDNDTGETCSQE